MWQGTGSTNKWNLSCYNPRVLAVLGWFSLICSRRGGSTAAAVTPLPTRAGGRWQIDDVTSSPARLCSRDGKIYYYGRLEYDFLAFVPCFLLFVCSPSLSRYVYLLRVPSSVQQSSATLSKCVFYSTSSCVICILPHLGIPLFLFV